MPDRLFKWLRPENRKPFYVVISLLVFAGLMLLSMSMERPDKSAPIQTQLLQMQANDSRMKVIGFGGAIITGLYLIVRGEQSTSYQHKTHHDIRETNNALALNARAAVITADEAADKAKAAVEDVERAVRELAEVKTQVATALNGGMKARIDQVFEQAKAAFATDPAAGSAFPRTMPELRECFRQFADEMGEHVCADVAEKASTRAVEKTIDRLRNDGWRPPDPLTVQT